MSTAASGWIKYSPMLRVLTVLFAVLALLIGAFAPSLSPVSSQAAADIEQTSGGAETESPPSPWVEDSSGERDEARMARAFELNHPITVGRASETLSHPMVSVHLPPSSPPPEA